MENKESYTPKEVKELAEIVSSFEVNFEFFIKYLRNPQAIECNAKTLLEKIDLYKTLPENIRSRTELDLSNLERYCIDVSKIILESSETTRQR